MPIKIEVKLEDLVGEHLLSGVDEVGGTEEANVINFTLDGLTFTAMEDPEDGWRSSMESLTVRAEPTTNSFPPVKVVGQMKKKEVLILVDMVTGKTVLEVGTDDADDWYPAFVSSFMPENMACNARVTP